MFFTESRRVDYHEHVQKTEQGTFIPSTGFFQKMADETARNILQGTKNLFFTNYNIETSKTNSFNILGISF